MGEQLQPGAGGASVEAGLIQKVRALPPSLAARIGATAEALNLLDFFGQFPADCRLVAQALRNAALLGRVQQETARTAPLCVLVDMASLQRRQGDLAACLRWLLGLPNLRAVRFADGGSGSMLSEDEFGLLLQLVAAHPEAAGSVRHLGTWVGQLGVQFDAGILAPLTRLRTLELSCFTAADLLRLPPSVHSVEMVLPGNKFAARLMGMALAAGQLEGDAAALINEMYQQLGWVQPLTSVPAHHLTKLHINADGLSLQLSASQLFGAAAAVQLVVAGRLQLLLPLPSSSLPWSRLVKQTQRAGGSGVQQWLLLKQCTFALLEAFQSTTRLETILLCTKTLDLQLPLHPGVSAIPAIAAGNGQPVITASPAAVLHAMEGTFKQALGLFGQLRTTGSKVVQDELQLSLRCSHIGAAAIRTCGVLDGACTWLLCAAGTAHTLSWVRAAFQDRWRQALWHLARAWAARLAVSLLEEHNLEKLLLRCS